MSLPVPEGATHILKSSCGGCTYLKFCAGCDPIYWCNDKQRWFRSNRFNFDNLRLLLDFYKEGV